MIPYNYLHMLPVFRDDMRHFAVHNHQNIINIHKDPEKIMKQLNGHIEQIQTPEVQQKLFDKKVRQINPVFLDRSIRLDNRMEHNLINERYRPDIFGTYELKEINDLLHRYHKSIATNEERKIIDYYSLLESEYLSKLYVLYNIEDE